MLFFYAPNYAKSRRGIMLNYALGENYAKLCQVMLLEARDERYESYDEVQSFAPSGDKSECGRVHPYAKSAEMRSFLTKSAEMRSVDSGGEVRCGRAEAVWTPMLNYAIHGIWKLC